MLLFGMETVQFTHYYYYIIKHQTFQLLSSCQSRLSLLTSTYATLVLFLTRTLQTSPFLPRSFLRICPRAQEFLGVKSSTISTRSSCRKFLLIPCHSFCCCKIGTHSWTYLLQKRLARYCTCLHLLLECRLSFLNSPKVMTGLFI